MADFELIELAPGKIANVVTYLSMNQKPDWASVDIDQSGLYLRQDRKYDLPRYRELFLQVGQEWLWSSRLDYDDTKLADCLHDEQTNFFEVMLDDNVAGMVELYRHSPQDVEITFFGLKPEYTGRKLGRNVMQLTLNEAWTACVQKVWLHTCTFDHPGALKFYQRCGFEPTGIAVEIMDDPRLLGRLPETAGLHIPLLKPLAKPSER